MRDPNEPRRFFRIEPAASGVEREVDDELQFHFDMTVRDLMAKGMSPGEARREAERRFGDVSLTRDRLTEIDRQRVNQDRRAQWWSALAQDTRYTLRGLRLKPGFAAVVVIALALGIGANATMFDIVDRLLFRAPAYLIAPERTHHLYFERVTEGKVFTGNSAQYQRFLDISRSAKTTEVVGAFSTRRVAVGVGESTRELTLGAMSASLWQLFNARPVIGRFFGADEDRDPGGARVVVLSYGYWKSQYAGSDSVLGKVINVGPAQYTIIGVAPRGFAATQMLTPSAFVPIAVSAVDSFGEMWQRYRTTYNITWLEMFVRRKPNVNVEAMIADLSAAYRKSYEAQIVVQPRTTPIAIAKPRVVVYPVFEERGPSPSADTKVATWLLGVAGIVLLIACANVGNLLLGRALYRQREIAVRMALGVGRARLVAQLLVESLVLACLGAIGGLLVAQWGGRVLRALLIPQVEWEGAIGDQRVLLFAGVTAVIAGVLAGMAPVLQSRRTDVAAALKAGPREGYGHRSRLRTTLLVLQAALSVVLLIGAGLFVRSLQKISAVDAGYDVDRLVWVEAHLRGTQLDLPSSLYTTGSSRQRLLREAVMDRARQNPVVENVSVALTVPFSTTYSDDLYLPGADSASKLGAFIMQGTSPSYFATTGTRIVRGRPFNSADREGAPLVVIVSQSVADGLWPKQDAIGKCVKTSADTTPCREVIGIAENVKIGSFAEDWDLVYYLPEAQLGANYYSFFIRVRGNADAATEILRRWIQPVMPGAGYVVAKSFSEIVAPSMRSWQLGATMFAVFGGLALALAAIGLYSVVAHSVVQRTHEMGVRVALGARRADVVRLIVGESLGVVVVGVILGAIAAIVSGRWVQPLLFGVSAHDPLVLVAVVFILPAVALAASCVPALRASRVDPNVALRSD
jgi:putative ABC transport system permease protein